MPETKEDTSAEEEETPERTSIWTEKYLQGIAIGVAAAVLLIGLCAVIFFKMRKAKRMPVEYHGHSW